MAMTDTILAYQSVGIRITDASTVTVDGVLWFADQVKVSASNEATVVLMNEHNGDPASSIPTLVIITSARLPLPGMLECRVVYGST